MHCAIRGTGALVTALLCVLALPSVAPAAETDCPPLSGRGCAMPFPNDRDHTVADGSTPTGRRVRLSPAATPANKAGTRFDVSDYNRADGFSPGQQILVKVPGLSGAAALRRSNVPPVDDLERYRDRDAGVVVLDARTGRRHPVWAELDTLARRADDRLLMIHPARNFVPGRRYVVVLRGLRRAGGARIAPVAGRAAGRELAAVRGSLRRARIATRDVHLAWRFTVASERSLQGRMLAMRNEAFAGLGDPNLADGRVEGRAPGFEVTEVTTPDDPRVLRRIRGTYEVPCYLAQPSCGPGARFALGPNGLPQTSGAVYRARLECSIPRAAVDAPARLSMYGHGILGNATQIDDDNIRAMGAEHNFVFCATDWRGMSAEDVPFAIQVLGDLSRFPALADRLQQGFLNQLFLGRLMLHPQGLAAHPAFQVEGRPAFDGRELFFDSNSQGGLLGVALTAINPDVRRAVLGVPAINYSVLLTRSIDFDIFARVLQPAYPDAGDRLLGLTMIQLLWDRGEGNGWAQNLTTDPPAGTPPHTALLHAAVADKQVSNWQTDVLARTAGVPARRPTIAPARTPEEDPQWGIPAITRFPHPGSALVYWDAGADFTGTNPVENVPARTGRDPHYTARTSPVARRQKAEFLRTGGAVVDVCPAGTPCEGADDDTP